MNTKIRNILITPIFGLGMLLLVFSSLSIPSSFAAPEPSTQQEPQQNQPVEDPVQPVAVSLEDVYELVQIAGAYQFTADSEQTLVPRPLPNMIGQTEQMVNMAIEGEARIPDYTRFSVSLDGAGLDPTPVAIIQEGTSSYLLREGEKIPVENPVGLASPTGDFVSYFVAAENVAPCESDFLPINVTSCYSFDINGRRFAEHVRDITYAQLANSPDALPPGTQPEVSPSPMLMNLSGDGKVWLDENGLPVRQTVMLHIPEMDELYDAEIHMVINYRFGPEAITAVQTAQAKTASIWSALPTTEQIVESAQTAVPNLFILLFFVAIVAGLTILRRRRWIYSAVAVSISISFVAAPLLQIIGYDLYKNRQVYAADISTLFAENIINGETAVNPNLTAAENEFLVANAAAAAQVYTPKSYCGLGGSADRDGDELNDATEYCLGTDPNLADSDSDGIPDGLEVTGFEFNSQTWYSNPLNSDTNGDGLSDGAEWPASEGGQAASWDLDEDDLPNLWDIDDDGDGVRDGIDLSPRSRTTFISSTPSPTNTQTLTDTFNFNITGAYDGYIYVDLQVQPQNSEHLRYSMTPIDWGFDDKGQIQDLNNSVDDVSLIPMLSVETNLPPDSDLAEQYNVVAFQDTDKDGYSQMLLPMGLVGTGGSAEAFGARLAYGPETLKNLGEGGVRWRNPHILWVVQGKIDSGSANGNVTEKSMSLHTYVEPGLRVVGWQVTKSGTYRTAILGTPNYPDDDRYLFQLLFGLSSSFLIENKVNLDEINARFSGANTPIEEKWGITTTVQVDLVDEPYGHFDEGLADVNARVKTFLSDNYTWDTPNSVLIASESNLGVFGQDDLGKLEPAINSLSINLNLISLATQRTLNLNMRKGWTPLSGGDLATEVISRTKTAVDAALLQLKDQYPDLTAAELMALTQSIYTTWEIGRTRLVSIDGNPIAASNTTDQDIYKQIYLDPRDRYNDPANISTLPGYLVEVGRFAQKGSGLAFKDGGGSYMQANTLEADIIGFIPATVNFVEKANQALTLGLNGATTFSEVDLGELTLASKETLLDNEKFSTIKSSISNGIGVVDTVRSVADAAKGWTKGAEAAAKAGQIATKVQKVASVAGKISTVVGYVGLAVEIGFALYGFFAKGDFSLTAIAQLIATIIVAVVLFMISTIPPWVGAVIVAIFGLLDFALSFCKWCQDKLGISSISGWITSNLASYLYKEKPLTEVKDFNFLDRDMTLADMNMGYVVGNEYVITDDFQGIIQVAGQKGFDWNAVKNGAIVGGAGGALFAAANEFDLAGRIMGGPSNGENLSNSYLCGEFQKPAGITSITSTCPDNNVDYNLGDIPDNATEWTYKNPMTLTIPLNRAAANFYIPVNTKVEAQTVWDASVPIPPFIGFGLLGRIHWTKERTLTIPDDLSSEQKAEWKATPVYIDVLPDTVEDFWHWGETESMIINHDPDGDGWTTKDEITGWLGSGGYANFQTYFKGVGLANNPAQLDQLLANWDSYRTDIFLGGLISNFCTIYPTLAGLCDEDQTPPWLTWDFDNDGLSDKFEFENKGRLGTNWLKDDTDGDGLLDGFEYQIQTRVDEADSDGDGLSDPVELSGWSVDVPNGWVGPNGRITIPVHVFSNPLNADTDGDSLSDYAEKQSGTSPAGFDRVPRIRLTGRPTAVSPSGISAIYVKPGDAITLSTSLEVYPPYTVSSTLSLNLPGGAFGFPTTTQLNGSRTVPNTGVTLNPRWSFANNVLQPWEYLHASTTSYVAWPASSLVTTATLSLPFGGESQSLEALQRIVVDVENPEFSWMTPSEGELIGGGVSHYVIGGTSHDATTWVNQLNLDLPGNSVVITDTDSFSPWAYTWELPTDGIYNLSGRSHDFVGHTSTQDIVEVMIDNTAPVVDVDLVDGAVFGPPQDSGIITITLSGSATENLSGLTRVQISTDDGPWREVWTQETATVTNTTYTDFTANFQDRATYATWDAIWTLPNVESVQGYHSLRVRAFDEAGNWPVYLERTIIIDVLPPTDELVNRAYIYEFPHVVADAPHTFQGVANDVGNVPQPSRPAELVGSLDSVEDATIWLGLSNVTEGGDGVNVAWIGDFNGDRRGDLLVGLPAAADGAGQVAVVYGRSGDWPVPNNQEMLSSAPTTFIGLPGAGVGLQAIAAGDVNGDGLADLLIGDPANNRVYIIFGNNLYLGQSLLLNGEPNENWLVLIADDGELIGSNIGAAGDINGDGFSDLLIGATGTVNNAYLLLGQDSGWTRNIPLNDFAAAVINGAGTAALAGLGDLDGDFRDEFAFGTNNQLYLFAGKGSYAPRAGLYLTLSGSAVDTFSSADATPTAVALGDVDGNNIDDFIYSNGASQVLALGDSSLDATWSTQNYSYGTGFLAAPGDVDNDGRNDILIGGSGTAYLILGSDIGAAQATIAGVAAGASTPYAAGADLNSDGSSDLLLVPTATSGQAGDNASSTSFGNLPPNWVPRLSEATLDTFVGSVTWPNEYVSAYVNADGVCHGLTPCYSTIQAAVDNHNNASTILVQPGVYAPFIIDGDVRSYNSLTVRGMDTDAVIIDGNNGSYAIRVNNAIGVNLENMTVRNASYGVQLDRAGINGHEITNNRTDLRYMLIYGTASHDIYMSRESTASVINSTLARSSNHIGAYGAADPNIVVEWTGMASSDWPILPGGGAVTLGEYIYTLRGGGNSTFGRYDIAGNYWSPPWGPQNNYEDNSAIALGSDDQVYILGAPHWRDTTLSAGYDFNFAAGGNGIMYAVDGNYDAFYWNGSDWSAIPGSPDFIYLTAAHPVNGNLYVYDFVLDQVLMWDGSIWTTVIDTGFNFTEANAMAVGKDGTIYFGGDFTNVFRGEFNPSCSGQLIDASPSSTVFSCRDLGEGARVLALATSPTNDTVYVGGIFEYGGAKNLTSFNGASIGGVTDAVYGIDVDDEGVVYVSGAFTSTLSWSNAIDQATPAGIASWDGSWTSYPIVIDGDPWYDATGADIAAVGGGRFFAAGSWRDPFGSGGDAQLIYWNGTGWEKGNITNDTNNPAVWSMAAAAQGVFISGHVTNLEFGGETVNTGDYNFLLQSPFEVYSTTAYSWYSGMAGPPIQLGDGASMAGDDYGNLVVLAGDGRTDSFKYTIETGEWSRVTGMNNPVSASAMAKGEDGYVYAITPSGFYRFDGFSWTAVGPSISGATLDDGATMAYDSHFGTYYLLPGGNGSMMFRYNPAWGSSWVQLPAERNTPSGVRPGAGLVFVEGEDENRLYTAQGNYDGGSSTQFWMYPLPMPNKIDFTNSIIYAQNGTNWLNYSDPLPEDFNFRVDGNSRFFGGTGWTPTNMGTLPTTTDTPFLDAARDLYRMGETGATYTIGYHIYTAPMTATTSTGIQAAVNSGANLVIVQPGIYEEDLYLVNGVEVVGTNPDWTIIRPLNNSTATALVRAQGVNGASLSRFTLDGQNSGLDGFAATGNAANLTLQRALIYDTNTAIPIDGAGTDLEVVHATVVLNNNGLVATNCASIDVRNSIFAYHTGSGLSHEACAAVQLHTYNLYWANASDFGADADAGAAELFLDPNFVDPMDHDYRTLNFSPVIDAGNPTDPSPPGAGSRADIGYIEQGRISFYVDDSYCEICTNDGLTWQVDAFDTIQDALNAAQSALANLNPTYVDVPQLVVGVAPGTYLEQIAIPSHVLLMGSGAEATTLDGGGGTAVSFTGVTDAGIHDFSIINADTAVHLDDASNTISMQRNILLNNSVGLTVNGRATVNLEYNTLVNNQTGVLADGSGSWAALMHNIVTGSTTGVSVTNNGQIFTDYNLYFNSSDFSNAAPGENDLVGQSPDFASGSTPYRLNVTSPAVDAASPFSTVPNGGGTYADLGYSELLAAPITLLLGQEDLSTVMGNSGVASVEYGIVQIPDPTTAVTTTLPGSWAPITLNTPGETYSYWTTDYTPLDEGLYRFYSRATDMVGNSEEDELDWYDGSFVVDSTPPAVTWLTPLDGASLTAPLELRAQVSDYAAGEFSVEEKDVYFEVDGQRYPATWAAEPWDETSGQPRVFRAWISPTLSTFTSVIAGAEDKAGNIATDDGLSFTVTSYDELDTTPPTVTVSLPLNGAWLTHTVTFSGTVTDLGSGIASVEVSVDGGATWRASTVSDSDWSLTWDGPESQSFISYPAQVRATDRAGNVASQSLQFTVDEVTPTGLVPVTFNYPENSHFDAITDLQVDWQPAFDASGVVTTLLTVDQITDTIPTGVVTETTAVSTLNANGDWYVHLAAIDAAGNAKMYHYGPWHVGINDVPFAQRMQSIVVDGFVDTTHNEWRLDTEYLDDDERTIGSNVTYSPNGQQSFLTAWDANNYFMAWRGGYWTLDGDLWIYLKTGGSGSTELIAPLAAAPGATLPFAANYAIQITDPLTGTLYEYNGGWQISAEAWAFAQGSHGDTEIRLPLWGTSDVEVLAFGLGDDQNVWAIFPATNPLTPAVTAARPAGLDAPAAEGQGWVSYQWDDVTAVTNVADSQPQAIAVELSLDSLQAPQAAWGPGSTLQYVLTINNLEAEPVTGQQLTLAASATGLLVHDSVVGAACATTDPWTCTLDPLAPGRNLITLTTHLAADLAGSSLVTLNAALTDSNIPPEMDSAASFTHRLDGAAPEVTVTTAPFVGLGSFTIEGTANDGDGVGVDYVEVRPQFGSWQRAAGTDLWTVDLTVSPFAQHGDTWQFEVRAADMHGQVSEAQLVIFTVDLLGPEVTFNSPTELSGSFNEIAGVINDVPSSSQASEVMVQLDDEPWRDGILFAPDQSSGDQPFLWTWNMPTEDGVLHTLRVQTLDMVGNIGTLSPEQLVWVDNVTPVLTVTEVLTEVAMQHYYPGAQIGDPVLAGTVTDGTEVAGVSVWVELPDGSSYVDTAVLNNNTWDFVPSLQALGSYKLQVRAFDSLGNQTQTEYYALEVKAAPESGPNTFYTPEDTPISFEPLLDDIDIDSDTIYLDAVDNPANGTATISGDTWIIYTPTLNFNGLEVFTYTASDGQFTDTATVTVSVLPVNDPPIIDSAEIITATMAEDDGTLSFSFTGINVDDDSPIWSVDEGMGTAVIANIYGAGNLNADIVYTPELDFGGIDSFRVRLSDDDYTDEITVQVTVTPVDDAPRAADDYLIVVPGQAGQPLTLDVLANDEEVDGQAMSVTNLGTPTAGGSAQISNNKLVYTPNLAQGQSETVTYTVSDGVLTDTAVLHISAVAGAASGQAGDTITASNLGSNSSIDAALTIPANVYSGSQQIAFVLRETAVPASAPQGYKFAGLAFVLDVYLDGLLTTTFVPNAPIQLDVTYSEADVADIGTGDSEIMLYGYDSSDWLTDGINLVERDTTNNQLAVSIETLRQFAIFGKDTLTVFLPMVVKP